jgi:hypothetical protein
MFPDGVRNALGALVAPTASLATTAVSKASVRAGMRGRRCMPCSTVRAGRCSILVKDLRFHTLVSAWIGDFLTEQVDERRIEKTFEGQLEERSDHLRRMDAGSSSSVELRGRGGQGYPYPRGAQDVLFGRQAATGAGLASAAASAVPISVSGVGDAADARQATKPSGRTSTAPSSPMPYAASSVPLGSVTPSPTR